MHHDGAAVSHEWVLPMLEYKMICRSEANYGASNLGGAAGWDSSRWLSKISIKLTCEIVGIDAVLVFLWQFWWSEIIGEAYRQLELRFRTIFHPNICPVWVRALCSTWTRGSKWWKVRSSPMILVFLSDSNPPPEPCERIFDRCAHSAWMSWPCLAPCRQSSGCFLRRVIYVLTSRSSLKAATGVTQSMCTKQ